MATIALFHSVLGPRPGFLEAAELLRKEGHVVHAVDQYDCKVFDEYEPAIAFMETLGFENLMARALRATASLPDGFVTMGFSNGAGMAEYVAGNRSGVSGVVMSGGGVDPDALGIAWPANVDGQVHTTVNDPWRDEGIAAVEAAAATVGAHVEVFDYPGSGHLFADASRPDEFQPAEAELMWSRVFEFLARLDRGDR